MEDKKLDCVPSPFMPESPVQRFRNAVNVAAYNLLVETGCAVSHVEMKWNEPTTGDRTMKSMAVDFAVDEIDSNWIWGPYPDQPPIGPFASGDVDGE